MNKASLIILFSNIKIMEQYMWVSKGKKWSKNCRTNKVLFEYKSDRRAFIDLQELGNYSTR